MWEMRIGGGAAAATTGIGTSVLGVAVGVIHIRVIIHQRYINMMGMTVSTMIGV